MYKQIHWVVAALLGLFSPALFALGLGGAVVKSYLDQTLDVRIELISRSGEELQSVTAGLASVEDFELLGMSRAAISVPLKFELVTDTAQPYIHVTSDLKINEPVVQVLVEVVWASGRMLREYTLFLDPPTIASQAPPVVIKPTPKPAATTVPATESTRPPAAAVQRTPKPEAPQPVREEIVPDTSATAESVTDESENVEPIPEEPVAEEPVTEEPVTEESRAQDDQQDNEVYGPVASGETLWGIARDFSRGTGYSVNQTMLALQRKNPEAFIRDNINSLKRGAILRLPAFSEIGELTSREAMLEVIRQGQEAKTGVRTASSDFSTPTVADSGDYQKSVTQETPEAAIGEDSGHLELVPPAEEDIPVAALAEQVSESAVSTESILEELSRTEEELVNAQQENTYLTQRIQELEAEVSAQKDPSIGVADTGLANLETSLAKQRASDQPDTPVAITPGGETQPWYGGKTGLLAGVAIVLIALIVWIMRRRTRVLPEEEATVVVPVMAVEAKDHIPGVKPVEDEGKTLVQKVAQPKPKAKPRLEPKLEPDLGPVPPPQASRSTPDLDDDKTVVQLVPEFDAEAQLDSGLNSGLDIQFADDDDMSLDDDASDENDPEIKLDLARAYLSLGDKEASKSMLDEVLKNGTEKQKAEARQMMDEL